MAKKTIVTDNKDSRSSAIAALTAGIKGTDKVLGGVEGAKVGKTYTLKGTIEKIPIGDKKDKRFFLACPTEEGFNISVKQLIGSISAEGYKCGNEGQEHHFLGKDAEGKEIDMVKTVTPTVHDESDLDDYEACPYRSIDDFLQAYYPDGDNSPLAGLEVTFAGKAIRVYTATSDRKKANLESYEENWLTGMQRCIIQPFWITEWPDGVA